MVFEVEVRTSRSPRIAPVLAIRAPAESLRATRPQAEAILPWADLVGVTIGGVTTPGVLPQGCGLEDLADGLGRVLDELGLPRVNVCGSSFAGDLAYRFAVRHPDRLERVVLTGPAGRARDHLPPGVGPSEMATRLLRSGRSAAADFISSALLCLDPALPVLGRAVLRRALLESMHRCDDAELSRWLRCLELQYTVSPLVGEGPSVPLLAVTGEHDVPAPPAECRALAARCPGGVFATIKESDHFVFLTRSREHLDLTRRFLLDEPLDHLPYLAELERPYRPVPAGSAVTD
ncbi:alpha/beta hydrolase [Kitasatospora sp. NBC_01287]|uniref:alpha/beta fold hydrolase n=1 Tax=Kitasatospora sp. NBC_01287 TaxID=2903573 RepID=UPI0022569F32|nr:alpha/beta hydrolase [Kitasatospora sp. NBC_01287]MCX4745729.1 alpha/beta hydrolase [Kitasatospora sp. NBC_01287]